MKNQRDIFGQAGLITRFLKGDLNSEEQKQLEDWLNESDENRQLLESYKYTEGVQEQVDFFSSIDIDKAWQRVAYETGRRPGHSRLLFLLSGCAASILVVLLFFLYRPSGVPKRDVVSYASVVVKNDVAPGSNKAALQLADGSVIQLSKSENRNVKEKDGTRIGINEGELQYHSHSTGEQSAALINQLITPAGGTYKVLLPDGTKVWINASSRLKFPTRFEGSERRVELSGEAYFEVATNKNMPFRVVANGTEIKVLGTRFNVSAYGNAVKTSLAEGSVKVSKDDIERSVRPGQQAVTGNNQVMVGEANIDKALAWKEGVFWFEEDNMKEIMEQISRWYDVEVVFNGKVPASRLSGNIRRQAHLSQVLQMLHLVSNAGFEIDGRKVMVNYK